MSALPGSSRGRTKTGTGCGIFNRSLADDFCGIFNQSLADDFCGILHRSLADDRSAIFHRSLADYFVVISSIISRRLLW